MLKVIWGSFGAFPIFDSIVSRKRLVIEQNGVKFGSRGLVFNVYWVLSTVKWLGSLWGHGVKFGPRGSVFSVYSGFRQLSA